MQGAGASLFEDDKSSMDKLQNTLKSMVFEIIYYLISGDNFPMFIYVFFVIIESFQFFYFAFSVEFQNLWKIPEWSESFETFFGYFLIVPYLKSTTFNQFVLTLYIVMGFFLVMIILIVFIALKAKTSGQVNKLSGPLVILKFFFEILNYIFFFPGLQLFMHIFNCKAELNGVQVHTVYQDQQCYSGNYLLHGFLSGIASLILIIVSMFITLTFFESRYQPSNSLCKITGRDDMKFLIFKVVIVLMFTLLVVDDLTVLVLMIMTLLAMIQFFSFNKSSVYLNYYYSKIINSQQAIIMWTVCMIIFGLIVEGTYYEGIPYLWVFGSPLLVIIVMLRKEYRYDILMVDSNKFDSLNQAIQQLQYLTKFLNYYQTDRNIATLLDGFVEYHRTICKREDCPCQAKNMNQKKIVKFIKNSKLLNQDEDLKEQYVVLVYIIERIFILSLTRFPNCTELRISHSLFLMEKMQSNQQALAELVVAEQEKPYLDEQFLIYRLKKVIEEQMFENSKNSRNPASGIDAVNELTTENNLRDIRSSIEKSASLHIEFWSQLSEDTPDLGKLYEVGTRMMYIDNLLDESWKRILKMNLDVPPNLMMIYSRYLVDILYDKESAEEVLERLKNFYSLTMDRGKITNNINDFPNESTALVSISAEDMTFARIIGLNMSASKMFGYSKSELINRKVNILMPNMFSQSHDYFLETYLQTFESRIINKERPIFGKAKNGYIFPFVIYIRYVPSFIHGTQFFGSMRQEKAFKNVAFMIVNGSSLEIENITSNFISMFHIDINLITKKKMKITELVLDFQTNVNEYLSKSGFETHIEFKNRDQSVDGQYTVTAGEVMFKDQKLQGYIVKLEKVRSEKSILGAPVPNQMNNSSLESQADQQNNSQIMLKRGNQQNKNNPRFVFMYDQASTQFHGEFLSDANFQMSAISSVKQDETFDFSQKDMAKARPTTTQGQQILIDDEEEKEGQIVAQDKIDYAIGIRTMRLLNGQLFDFEEFRREEEEDDEADEIERQGGGERKNGQQAIRGEDEEDEAEGGHANIYKSRRTFIAFLEESRSVNQGSMTCFKWSGALLILSMGIIGLLDYILTQQQFETVRTAYILMEQSNDRVGQGQRVLWQAEELLRLNMINTTSTNEYVVQLKADLLEAIISLQAVQSQVQLSSQNAISGAQQELFETNVVKMTGIDQNGVKLVQLVDINQATSQIISKAFTVANLDITQFTHEEPNLYFLRYNLLNNYYKAVQLSAQLYTFDLEDSTNNKNQMLLVFLIVSAVFSFLALICITPIFNLVNRNQEEVIKLFLEIPLAKVKALFAKCEAYSNSLQIGEEEEAQNENDLSFDGDIDEGDGLVEEFGRRKKRKKFKYESKDKRNFYIKFLFSMIVLEAYFIAHYFVSNNMQTSLSTLIGEMNSTCRAVPYITFVNNVIRQMIVDATFPATNNQSYVVTTTFVSNLYNLNTAMQKDHSLNIGYHNEIYNTYFDTVMQVGACTEVVKITKVTLDQCKNFAKGIVDESLGLALSRHFENIRYVLTLYDSIKADPKTNFPGTVYPYQANPQRNKILSLLNMEIAAEINTMQDFYIRTIFQQLVIVFNSSMKKDLDTNTTTTVTIFIIFIIMLVLIYLLFWLPLANKINREVRRTTLLLSMIPLNQIQKIKSIRDYLNRIHKVDQ